MVQVKNLTCKVFLGVEGNNSDIFGPGIDDMVDLRLDAHTGLQQVPESSYHAVKFVTGIFELSLRRHLRWLCVVNCDNYLVGVYVKILCSKVALKQLNLHQISGAVTSDIAESLIFFFFF
jgi:hypothetical protein